jgi:S-methylmethionine-dependent homocysteine/selenocysteine methylase
VALANTEQPSIVTAAHSAFIEAGAGAIITNNYACVPATIGSEVVPHITAAGKVARESVGSSKALVLGSLPPLKATYRPDLVSPESEMARDYKTIAGAIAPHSDGECECEERSEDTSVRVTER